MSKVSHISIRQMIPLFISILAFFSGCKKSDPTPALPFTYLGTWTVHVNYTKGVVASGSFFATLHSVGRWAFMENTTSIPDIGPWSSFENSITFTFGLSTPNVVYTGRKNSNGTLSGTMIGYEGIATASGTWTATR